MIFIILFSLAFLVGYSVHRGGICLVGATREVLVKKQFGGFLFIFEAMTVAFAVVLSAYLLMPMNVHFSPSIAIGNLFIAGALLYGFGAAINAGCMLGTLNRFLSGEMTYLGTIFGIGAGLFSFLLLQDTDATTTAPIAVRSSDILYFLLPLLAVAWVMILVRLCGLFFSPKRSFSERLSLFLHEPLTRGFLAIFLLGVCSGALYLILGHAWDYSKWFMSFGKILLFKSPLNDEFLYVSTTSAGLLIGILSAAVIGKGFKRQPINWPSFLTKIIGGAMMGFATGYISGGNDTILLHAIPTLAFHAPFSLLLILLAIGVSLWLKMQFSARTR